MCPMWQNWPNQIVLIREWVWHACRSVCLKGTKTKRQTSPQKSSNKCLHHVKPLLLKWGTYQHLNDIEKSWRHNSANKHITQEADISPMIFNIRLWYENTLMRGSPLQSTFMIKYDHVRFNSQVVLLFHGSELWILWTCFSIPLFSILNKCVPNGVSD